MNYKLFYILLLFIGCKDLKSPKTDLEDLEQIVIADQEFKSSEAEKLNSDGVDFGKKGFSEKANQILLKALKIEPDNPTILNNLGLTYSHLNKNEKSILYFQKSLSVSDSTYLPAGTNLSLAYYNVGKYQEGIDIANFVIEKSEDKYVILGARIHKSFSLIKKGNCEKAKAELKIIRSYLSKVENLQIQITEIENRIKNCVQPR